MPPVNDDIANAIVITLPTSFTYDTTGSVLGPTEIDGTTFGFYPDVWYRIEPAVDVLMGVSVTQTGGPATDGPEIDLYRLVGSDPPTLWSDIDTNTWTGDGDSSDDEWYVGGSGNNVTYVKLQGGEIYYLDCADWNFSDEIICDVVLTTAVPLANDDWEDAQVINTVGGNVIQVTNVGATGSQEGTSESENAAPSVWYRIEVPDDGHVSLSVVNPSGYRIEHEYRHMLEIYGPVTDPVTDMDDILTAPTSFVILDNGPHSNHPPYDDSGGWEPWLREWLVSAGDIYYVRVSNDSQPGDPSEGSFTMRVTLREWTTFDAAPGINNGSATTSVIDTDWVKDTQYREIDPTGATFKGTLDYTKTFEVTPGLSGRYEIQVLGRFKSPTSQTGQPVNCIVRVNGVPVRVGMPLFDNVNNTAKWWNLTQEYMLVDDGGFGFTITPGLATKCDGGPRYVELAVGDVVSFDIGNDLYRQGFGPYVPPDRTFEVQKVRFSRAGAYDPLPSWNTSIVEFETFEFNDFSNFMACTRENKLYMFQDALYYTSADATTNVPFLNVIEYELVDGRMQAVNGDLPIDGSNPPADIAMNRGGTSDNILMKDICVLDSGDIYVLWVEATGFGTGGDWYIVLKKFDGSSWSTVSDDISGHGAPTNGYVFDSPNMDTDGTDIWIAWGENRTAFDFAGPPGWWWRCMHYDVSGNSFTELGSGQTAFPSAPGGSRAGDFDFPLRVRVSPGHVPYVLFTDFDATFSNDVLYYLWRWDGAAWEDMELPYPNPTPDPIGSTNASTFAPNTGNYPSATQDVFIPHDILFCHHDGPSETPSVLHSYWWNGIGAFSGSGDLGDVGTWFYAECDGIGDWHNEMLIIEGGQPEQAPNNIVYGNEYPQRFAHSTSDFDGNTWIPWGGGWSQGMKLVAYKDRPTFINTLGYFGQGSDCVYVAQINEAGDSWDLLGKRFPTDVYSPDVSGYQWSDMGEPGCLIEDTIVCYWEDESANSYTSYFMSVFQPTVGTIVSMNWRSATRQSTSRRVLAGG